MSDYYDRQGNAMTQAEWIRPFGDPDYKRVAADEITLPDGDVRVSTVWLGLDHAWGDRPPRIFETMVFGLGGNELLDLDPCWRYSSEDLALAGHAAVVAAVRAGMDLGALEIQEVPA